VHGLTSQSRWCKQRACAEHHPCSVNCARLEPRALSSKPKRDRNGPLRSLLMYCCSGAFLPYPSASCLFTKVPYCLLGNVRKQSLVMFLSTLVLALAMCSVEQDIERLQASKGLSMNHDFVSHAFRYSRCWLLLLGSSQVVDYETRPCPRQPRS